jgi:hypothetical protein
MTSENNIKFHPPSPDTNTLTEQFALAAQEIVESGKIHIQKNTQEKKLIYHSWENHINSLYQRSPKIAKLLQLTEKEIILLNIAIAKHDEFMDSDDPQPHDIIGTRIRRRGARQDDSDPKSHKENGNEARSAGITKAQMEAKKDTDGSPVFTPEEISQCVLGIEFSYPEFNFLNFKSHPRYSLIIHKYPQIGHIINGLEEKSITQGLLISEPHLENRLNQASQIPKVSLALSLLDLSSFGMGSSEELEFEGDNEFAEIYKNLSGFQNLDSGSLDTNLKNIEDKDKIASEINKWLKNQIGVTAWQMIRYADIGMLLEKNRQFTAEDTQNYMNTFDKFPQNIEASYQRSILAQKKYDTLKKNKVEESALSYLLQTIHLR